MSEGRTRRLGTLAGLAAAALFGIAAPLSKMLSAWFDPLRLAALLYLGAALGLSCIRLVRRNRSETQIKRGDLLPLAGVVLTGGVLGPILMLTGLRHTSALAGSLLLNLEGLLTFLLAIIVFREHATWRAAAGAGAILGAALILGFGFGQLSSEPFGVLAISAACACWAIDNNLTQRLSLRDPLAIAQTKTVAAGLCNLALSFAFGMPAPVASRPVLAALVVGAFGYGVSILLDVYALRFLGAARESAFFATAPFIGALASVPLLHESLHWGDAVAGALMALGVVLLLSERHSHAHVHEVIEHEHLHTHDEHHHHAHAVGELIADSHSHVHRHEPLTHEHRHVSDAHHRHRH